MPDLLHLAVNPFKPNQSRYAADIPFLAVVVVWMFPSVWDKFSIPSEQQNPATRPADGSEAEGDGTTRSN